jgi:hypothetical protein
MAAASVVSGAAITISVEALWLLVGTIPPAVMLLVWRSGSLAAAAKRFAHERLRTSTHESLWTSERRRRHVVTITCRR